MTTFPHEWLCRYIVDHTQDAVIFADREGRIRLWNTGAATIFGYPAAEALGHSLDLIIPERLRARHWEGYRRVITTGSTPYDRQLLAVPALRKDGTQISLEFTVVLVHEPPGEVRGIAAVLRDVTERWQREKAMQGRLAAFERTQHAGDVTPRRTDPMDDLLQIAEAVRQACIAAALRAYEDGGCSGLCHEGRWEYAVDAMRAMPLRPVVHALLHGEKSPAPPADTLP